MTGDRDDLASAASGAAPPRCGDRIAAAVLRAIIEDSEATDRPAGSLDLAAALDGLALATAALLDAADAGDPPDLARLITQHMAENVRTRLTQIRAFRAETGMSLFSAAAGDDGCGDDQDGRVSP